MSPTDFSDSEGAIRIIEDFPLDVFTIMRGNRYADLVGATKSMMSICAISTPRLIALKNDSQRAQDRIDVSALRSLQEETSQ